MKNTLARYWPLVVAVLVLWLAVSAVLVLSLRQTHGTLAYALDDAYIHMAVAKNLALHGVFGATRHEFSSSSSSLLWTFVLTGVYLVVGVNSIAPLALNVVFATLLLWLADAVLWRGDRRFAGVYVLAALLAIAFVTPFPALICAGMEHVLHALVSVAFLYVSSRALAQERFGWRTRDAVLSMALAPCVTLARYEGVFLAFIVCCLFLLRRKVLYAVVLGALALLPLGIYALYSTGQGAFWVPNSVMVKGKAVWRMDSVAAVLHFLAGGYGRFWLYRHLTVPVIFAVAGFALRYDRDRGLRDPVQMAIVAYVFTALLHILLGPLGWFYRYEAYLVALGLFVVAWAFVGFLPKAGERLPLDRRLLPKYAAVLALVLAPLLPLATRAAKSLLYTPRVMRTRYLMHVVPALFVAEHYDDQFVVCNDLGAIAYYSNAGVLDVIGLGSVEPLKFRLEPDGYTKDDVRRWAKDKSAKIGILCTGYDPVTSRIPDGWVMVAQWQFPFFDEHLLGKVAYGPAERPGTSVWAIYAVDPSEVEPLRANLKAFEPELPSGVKLLMQGPA